MFPIRHLMSHLNYTELANITNKLELTGFAIKDFLALVKEELMLINWNMQSKAQEIDESDFISVSNTDEYKQFIITQMKRVLGDLTSENVVPLRPFFISDTLIANKNETKRKLNFSFEGLTNSERDEMSAMIKAKLESYAVNLKYGIVVKFFWGDLKPLFSVH